MLMEIGDAIFLVFHDILAICPSPFVLFDNILASLGRRALFCVQFMPLLGLDQM